MIDIISGVLVSALILQMHDERYIQNPPNGLLESFVVAAQASDSGTFECPGRDCPGAPVAEAKAAKAKWAKMTPEEKVATRNAANAKNRSLLTELKQMPQKIDVKEGNKMGVMKRDTMKAEMMKTEKEKVAR